MKQKNKTRLARAAMTLLLALLTTFGAWAQTTVEIGDGTSTGYYTPIGTYYNYSITEQLYTADEIGMAGTISSISFNYVGSAAKEFPITVYMANVDAADLSTGISLAGADEVFNGTLSVTGAGWVTIDLDTPFAYNGTSNLLIGINKDYVQWFSGSTWRYTSAANMARYSQNDDNAYTTETVPGTVTNYRPNIQIAITAGSGPVCDKPETLEASNVTSNSVTLTWSSGSGTYNVEYKKNSDTEWTSLLTNTTATTTTLSGLTPGTSYQARVQSVCGEDVSGWKSVSFSTLFGIPLVEGFGTSIPAGWAQYTGLLESVMAGTAELASVNYGWNFGTGNGVFDDHARVNIYGTSCNKWLVLPTLAMEDNVQLSFDLALTAYSGNLGAPQDTGIDDKFVVLITTDDGTTWSVLRQWDNAGSEYVLNNLNTTPIIVTLDLSSYKGKNVSIAFYGESTESNADNNLHIDNVSIDYIPACPKPTGLTVNYTGGTTAEVSWTSDAGQWQLAFVDPDGSEQITKIIVVDENPCTLTDLELATTYGLAIRTVCGEDLESEWTSLKSPVTFTTDACMPEDMIVVNYTLNDEYGDGWNGNYILVLDENCNIVEQITLASGASATGTVKVCGSLAQFMWYMASSSTYPGETSWTFTDADGNVIFEGTGSTDMANYDVLYTIDLNPYSMPSDIEVSEVGPYSAKVAWTETGTATAWQIGIFDNNDDLISTVDANSNPFTLTGLDPETDYYVKVRAVGSNGTSLWPCIGSSFTTLEGCGAPTALNITPYPTSAEVDWANYEGAYDIAWAEVPATKDGGRWMQYDNGTHYTNVGSNASGLRTWGVLYGPDMIQGYTTLSKVALQENANFSGDYTISIYSGGETEPGTLLATKTVTPGGSAAMVEITLDEPLAIDPLKNLWITVAATGTYVMPACTANDYNNQWWLQSAGWSNMGEDNQNLAGYGWMIRGYVENYDANAFAWNSETGIEPPYTIENLNAETTYMVKVKASCGTEWKWVQFTTPSACDAPIDLAANDVTADAATLSWTGYQDSYTVRYRTAENSQPSEGAFFDDFESGNLEGWTILREGEGTDYTDWHVVNSENLFSSGPIAAHSGTNVVMGRSWNNDAYSVDNWLVTPQVSLNGTLSYWVRDDGEYHEHYEVYVSTTTNDPTAFTLLYEPGDASDTWTQHTVDLTSYNGQQGYIAFRLVDEDQDYLFIDDVLIGTIINTPAGEWTTKSATSETLDLTGLTPDTEYEWQVQGVNAGCDDGVTAWSGTSTFTTWGVENINFAADGYATYYNSIRDVVLPEGMKAHVVTAGSATLTYNKVADGDEENNVVPAGTAMLLQVEEAAADHSISVYLARPSVAAYTGTNLMFGSDVETTTTGGDKYYKLTYSSSGTNFGWYWGAANGIAFSSPAHKAWLALPASGAPSFLGLPDWDTTGIVPVGVNPEDGEWYTLQGMKVGKKPTTAGVYIHNGKKFVIK